MKFFAIFATLLALTCAKQQWTLHELSEAIQNPETPADMIPYLENMLNNLMLEAMTGQHQDTIAVAAPVNPAQELSTWSLHELSEALQNPNTPAELVPYLEAALNTMMVSIFNGEQQEAIIVATPVGLLPVAPIAPAPVVTPAPVASVVAPAPVVTPASSPLVQMIININQQEASVAAPAPVVLPAPVPVLDWVAPVRPEPEHSIVPVGPTVPVNPVDIVAITPPQAIINPVDVIAITPPQAIINPVDVIAIAAPEINPVDILSPVPVVAGIAPVVGPLL